MTQYMAREQTMKRVSGNKPDIEMITAAAFTEAVANRARSIPNRDPEAIDLAELHSLINRHLVHITRDDDGGWRTSA
jgi:hypothetical protein